MAGFVSSQARVLLLSAYMSSPGASQQSTKIIQIKLISHAFSTFQA